MAKQIMLDQVTNTLYPDVKQKLRNPLSLSELEQVAKVMAKGKSFGHDGLLLEFYLKLWPSVGLEFLSLIQQSLLIGKLPLGVNKDLIALIHKGETTNELTNYRSITLLNVSYKIFAKALQQRLQPFFPNIINED